MPACFQHRKLLQLLYRICLSAGEVPQLVPVYQHAEQNFVALLTSLPNLVESYESVDSNGASVRRYMINDPSSHLEVTTDPQARSFTQQHQEDEPGRDSKAGRRGTPAEGGSPSAPSIPLTALDRDLAYLQRRYRSAFLVASSSEVAEGSTSAGGVLIFTLRP